MRIALHVLATLALLSGFLAPNRAVAQESQPIAQVLRAPLPPEELQCQVDEQRVAIQGPTFRYTVARGSGALCGLEVRRGEQTVVKLTEDDFVLDDYRLATVTNGKTEVVRQGKDQVVLKTVGTLPAPANGQPEIPYTLTNTFFNDGVVVAELTLVPAGDVAVRREMGHRLLVEGRFASCLHKQRNQDGHEGNRMPPLPKPGQTVTFGGLSSCLQVMSHEAALAIFTDVGATHTSGKDAKSALLQTVSQEGPQTRLRLAQQIVDVGQDGEAYALKKGEEFRLRYGLCLAPNRLPSPRTRDLRMFIWAGDAKHPYPTDAEVAEVAQLGFTLFQMHRVGTPGEPRPPAGELERVIRKVHETGMLFLWTANADLMYASAPGVAELVARNQWTQWKGFNYGGQYKAKMDPYCDTLATCLASPNGLTDYRVQTLHRMMERYQVDGIYIDDNLAYGNCTLWKEHGHPRPVYDCLIELHEMSWRRRQTLREHCPHAVLVDHCSLATLLPVICDFDAHLFGEGYSFPSVPVFWNLKSAMESLAGQGCLFAGDDEGVRCASAMAYNFDLLSGGGQYCYLDWRLWPKKFPYAAGVQPEERLFVGGHNRAQYNFGLHESQPYLMDQAAGVCRTSAPQSYVAVYANRTWGDCLVPVVNLAKEPQATTLTFPGLAKLGLSAEASYLLYDVHARTARVLSGSRLAEGVTEIAVPAQAMRLFCLRPLPTTGIVHIWGGKRLAQSGDAASGKLAVTLIAPPGATETVVFTAQGQTIREVRVAGKTGEFFRDPASGLVHGEIAFGAEPTSVELLVASEGQPGLPAKALEGDELARYLELKPL